MFGLNNQFWDDKEVIEQSIILRLPDTIVANINENKNENLVSIIPYKYGMYRLNLD